MGLAEAEQWWERWQLRVLVLGSLSLQFFLLVAAALRRRRCLPLFRLLTWAAYIGNDALAIYALATLFTRRKKQQLAGGTSPSLSSLGSVELEALWAPVLLLHLGGQDGFTAYSIQDNELWTRHLFTAASQVAIAVYVFRKSWPAGGDGRVLAAAILLFFPGILKCLQKPWALCKSSTSSIATAVGAVGANDISQQQDISTSKHQDISTSKQQDISTSKQQDASTSKQQDTITDWSIVDDFVHKASEVYNNTKNQEVVNEATIKKFVQEFIHHLFVDLPYPYSVRLELLKYVWNRGATGRARRAHLFVRSGLSRTFDLLYTAGDMGYHSALLVLLLASSVVLVIVAATGSRNRGAFADDDAATADLKITYLLLCCTAGLEVVSAVTMLYIQKMMAEPPWPDQVAQCNLIGYLVHNEAHWWGRRLASLLGFQAYLDRFWCTAPTRTARSSPSSSSSDANGITDLIYNHIAKQWTQHYIEDTATYRKFSDSRGQWTLDKEGCHDTLAWSILEKPFDESVMIWHLATDMCFFHSVGGEDVEKVKSQCRAISNYMAYLLLVNPEMLMPGARRRIFTVAYSQVREVIVDGELPDDEDKEFIDKKKVPVPPGSNRDMVQKLIIQMAKPTETTKASTGGNSTASSRSTPMVKTTETPKDAAASSSSATPSNQSTPTVKPTETTEDADAGIATSSSQSNQTEKTTETTKDATTAGIGTPSSESTQMEKTTEVTEDAAAGIAAPSSQSNQTEKTTLTPGAAMASSESLVHDAWALAKELNEMGEDKTWSVICGVWVEMLCFSASRCRGYLHAKSLAAGGEYLSYVWLLRAYMGMETLADLMQVTEKGDLGAAQPSPVVGGNENV